MPEENGSIQWNVPLRPNGGKVDYPLTTPPRPTILFMGVGSIPISNVNEGLGTSGYSNLKSRIGLECLNLFLYFLGLETAIGVDQCVRCSTTCLVPPASPFHQTVTRWV